MLAQSQAGDVWFLPEHYVLSLGQTELISIHINTGESRLAAYGLDLNYDASLLSLSAVSPGPDGFLSTSALSVAETKTISGFDIQGTGPGPDLNLILLEFNILNTGITSLNMSVKSLNDPQYNTIGSPQGRNKTLPIVDPTLNFGDVNNSGTIDIIDALIVAQYYVGLIQTLVPPAAGDVNADGRIDIVDALMIAQYYVGLQETLPVIKGLSLKSTQLTALYPGGIPPVILTPELKTIPVRLRDASGNPLINKVIQFRSQLSLSATSALTNSEGIAMVSYQIPFSDGRDFFSIVTASFPGDQEYASISTTIKLRVKAPGIPTPTPFRTPTPLPTKTSSDYANTILNSSTVDIVENTITSTQIQVTITLFSACYKMSSWGNLQKEGNVYRIDTTTTMFLGLCAQVISTPTRTYNLGTLPPGTYQFHVYSWGNLAESLEFTIP